MKFGEEYSTLRDQDPSEVLREQDRMFALSSFARSGTAATALRDSLSTGYCHRKPQSNILERTADASGQNNL